jgi:hypothetical protein
MTHGIELCDANFQAARLEGDEPHLIRIAGSGDDASFPGFALHDGGDYVFGQPAEGAWFVQPRKVVHTFWSKLNHDSSTLVVPPRSPSYSEVAYYFLRNFTTRLAQSAPGANRMALAVPGVYLRDQTTEEEKIGLLLGMASDLKTAPRGRGRHGHRRTLRSPRAPLQSGPAGHSARPTSAHRGIVTRGLGGKTGAAGFPPFPAIRSCWSC